MPGTPDPALGSPLLTAVLACTVGAAVGLVPLALTARDSLPSPRRLALGGGLAVALASLAAWVGARLLTDAFATWLAVPPSELAGWLLVALVVSTVQTALPLYLYGRFRLVAPLAVLAAATALFVWLFLHVRGESDPLGLYVAVFGPVTVALLAVVALAEAGLRRALGSPAAG